MAKEEGGKGRKEKKKQKIKSPTLIQHVNWRQNKLHIITYDMIRF